MASAVDHLTGCIIERCVIYDDSGDADHKAWLARTYGRAVVLGDPERRGFGGAIEYAWQAVAETGGPRFVFHLEDDFVCNRDVPVDDMALILDTFPEVAQVALQRQPIAEHERAAGGVIAAWRDRYTPAMAHTVPFVMHDLFWTTNPSLISLDTIRAYPWPNVERSEVAYADLMRALDFRFAYL